jgi:hypothetical protein
MRLVADCLTLCYFVKLCLPQIDMTNDGTVTVPLESIMARRC